MKILVAVENVTQRRASLMVVDVFRHLGLLKTHILQYKCCIITYKIYGTLNMVKNSHIVTCNLLKLLNYPVAPFNYPLATTMLQQPPSFHILDPGTKLYPYCTVPIKMLFSDTISVEVFPKKQSCKVSFDTDPFPYRI